MCFNIFGTICFSFFDNAIFFEIGIDKKLVRIIKFIHTYHSSRFLRVSGQAQHGFNGLAGSPVAVFSLFCFDSPSQGIFDLI